VLQIKCGSGAFIRWLFRSLLLSDLCLIFAVCVANSSKIHRLIVLLLLRKSGRGIGTGWQDEAGDPQETAALARTDDTR